MTAPAYYFFWNGPFSQFHPSAFILDGDAYVTAEQYMMRQKALVFGDKEIAAKILTEPKPAKQKALGRKVRGFDDATWDKHKQDVVRRGSDAKYRQNKSLRRKLFQTGQAAMVEASPLDFIWGIGLSEQGARHIDPAVWPGQNLLGRILTETRDALRLDFPEEAAAADALKNNA